ncbi:MAG: alkaline phosphatase family protein [Gemmatimonadaceae bacterium]
MQRVLRAGIKLLLAVLPTLVVNTSLFAQAERSPARQPRTQNVILVVTDGLRWQEVFGGADTSLMFGEPRTVGGDTIALRRKFWRPTATERREAIMPFLWGTIAREGQIFGNRAAGSNVVVTNGLNFSYPGYHELLAGFVDPRIDRNDFGPNPNVTVFEWLNRQPGFGGRVAAFATWDVFADIFARRRSGVVVRAGWEPPYPSPRNAADSLLNQLYATTFRNWNNNAWDSFAHAAAMRYLTEHRPRVMFVGYGETDEWAHAGRYDRYLNAARTVDRYLSEIWSAVQAHPDYRGRTSLIVTTDHGRGRTLQDWSNHGRAVAGAEEMWLAVIGPDTPALGERKNASVVTQSQIAATVAALLGLDYRRDLTRAGAAVPGVAQP